MIRLYPCVERYLDRLNAPGWDTLPEDAPSHVRLSADVTAAAIGSVIATLARYNAASEEHATASTRESLAVAIRKAKPLLPGGVLAVDDDTRDEIAPGCCAGLEQWRGWVDFLDHGQSPWLGHDPTPYLVARDDTIELCCDEGDDPSRTRFSMSRAHYAAQLLQVERDLRSFACATRAWADAVVPEHAEALELCFVSAFVNATSDS
jgi:hypothetical protein